MNLSLLITCTECHNKSTVPIIQDDDGRRYLSDAIEGKQEGFHCNLNSPYYMMINCSCGHQIRMDY